jgi:cytidylate kinase
MAIITISRGTFSGGQKLAECIAAKLGYRCISREVLVETAQEFGVSEDKLLEALTKKPWLLERLTRARDRYLAYIRATLLKEVRDENVVYHGLAGHLLLKDVPHVFRIKVIANMEFRVKNAMERNNFSREEALQYIREVDEGRARWTRFIYDVDWNDPNLYDLVVNLDQITIESACEVVCHLSSMEGYQRSDLSKKIIADMVLATHLRALIAADNNISDRGVEVAADAGVVTVSGTVESIAEADRIRNIVRMEPGVAEIDSKLRVRLPVWLVGGV